MFPSMPQEAYEFMHRKVSDIVALVGQYITRSILCVLRQRVAVAASLTFEMLLVLLYCIYPAHEENKD